MELIIIFISSLWFVLSVSLTPCASLQLFDQVQSSHDHLAHDHQPTLPVAVLPRKLKLSEEPSVKGHEGQDVVSYHATKDALSAGKAHHKEAKMINPRRGTWQEWVEGSDTSQFFTMDYSHVRRRRPIHNKSLPVGP